MGILVPEIATISEDAKQQPYVSTTDCNNPTNSTNIDVRMADVDADADAVDKQPVVIDASCINTLTSSQTSSTHTHPFQHSKYINLVSSSHVLFATDEWFATADNLVKDSEPEFIPDLYCDQGKVMDGWETRRRRVEGHDWCVIALNDRVTNKSSGGGADVYGIELDTAFFTGNQTPRVSIEVANCRNERDEDNDDNDDEWKFTWMPGAVTRLAQGGGIQGTGKSPDQVRKARLACEKFTWTEILGVTELQPGYEESRMHYFTVPAHVRDAARGFTHVRVNYFPDGGVARMRLWGHPAAVSASPTSQDSATGTMSTCTSASSFRSFPSEPSFKSIVSDDHPELSSEANGGMGLSCSNKHYGVPSNLIRVTEGKDMGDGWETARHPERPPVLIKDPITDLIDSPLMDWAVLKLGMGGASNISRIILDTKHFKGNFPESVQVEGCDASSLRDISNADEIVCSVTPEMHGHGHGQGGEEEVVVDANQSHDTPAVTWFPLLKRSRMGPDQEHIFDAGESDALVHTDGRVTHVRISIFPDGGLSRVRIFGQPAIDGL